jgi:hypothetical protein
MEPKSLRKFYIVWSLRDKFILSPWYENYQE